MSATNWQELWHKNYKGEGDTKELQDFIKKLDYGSRSGVSYLPWAVVERIFKFQEGEYEIIRREENSIVEVDRFHKSDDIDENGIVEPIYIQSYFINIKAVWQGKEYVERYPLQSSTGQPLLHWTQNDLNKSVQRAKVKAIAVVSGIGYKLFEDGELQFDQEIVDKSMEKIPKTNPPKAKKQKPPVEKEKPTVEKTIDKEEEEEKEKDVTEQEEQQGELIKEIVIPKDRDEIENEIKTQFLKGGLEKAAQIKMFLKQRETSKIHELSDDDIRALYVEIV